MTQVARWGSVDRSPTPPYWQRPANLMPADVSRSWPRGRRAMTEAEEILATAEAWWDVDRSNFRDGDRYLRNIGQAGSVLDLRLGSSVNANSNDPKWLGPESTGYVYLPGVALNLLSTPNSTALNITGDIDIRVRVAMDSWTPANISAFVSKWETSPQRAYRFQMETTGRLTFAWSTDGTAISTASSTVSVTGSVPQWLRVTRASGTGDVNFYTAPDSVTAPSSWTQLGTTVTTTANSMFGGTSAVAVGVQESINYPVAGRIYRAQVLNGINGTVVLDVDCDQITSGSATTFTEQSSNAATVTINRATSGRKTVAMPSKTKGGRPLMLLGTDDYMECQDAAQHGLLNFYGSQTFSFLVNSRIWGTTSSYLLSKGIVDGSTGNAGYVLRNVSGTLRAQTQPNIGNTRTDSIEPNAYTSGNLAAHVNTYGSKNQTAYLNGTSGTPVAHIGGSLFNTYPLRVGVTSQLGVFAEMEFTAAAIWRRALTSREIAVINNTAPWGA